MNNNEECISFLTNLAEEQGFLLFDDIIDAADTFDLSISAIDEVSESLQLKGIIFYESAPDVSASEQYDDYSKINYNDLYAEVLSIDPSLSILIERVSNIKPVQYGEMSSLTKQSANGNSYARERIILSHMRVAIKIALSMTKTHDFDLADTISAAFIGLVNATDRFDPNGFSSFQGYAAMWIMQSIQRECKPRWIEYYFPVHYRDKMVPIYEKYVEYSEKSSFSDTEIIDVLSKDNQLSIPETKKYLSTAFQQINGKISLENQVDEQYVIDTEELQYTNDYLKKDQIEHLIQTLMKVLSTREADVIKKRYGIGIGKEMTLEQIGLEYGVTRERIRQIESTALRKLKIKLNTSYTKDDYSLF